VDILSALFRWIHILAGIVWIGMLYFFNFVNGPFQGVIDGDTKKKVNPELMPRALKSALGKDPKVFGTVCFVLSTVVVWLMASPAAFTYRAFNIHLAALFGTIMAFNVWFRIWPAQKKILTAVKNGTAPDAALVALAGVRSRHNTYMSAPLLWGIPGLSRVHPRLLARRLAALQTGSEGEGVLNNPNT
jgi:uncharacterized membrane protein